MTPARPQRPADDHGLRWLLLPLIIGLVLRTAYLLAYAALPDWDLLTIDAIYHHNWATAIASGNLLGDTTYFRAPLYAWLLGAGYAVAGPSLWAARILGLLIGLASVTLTFLIARKLLSARLAAVAALLHAAAPILIYSEAELLSDSLFLLAVQLVVLRTVMLSQQVSRKSAIWLGIAIGFAALTRPTGLVLLIPAAVVCWGIGSDSVSRLKHLGVVLVSAVVIIVPVTIRNLIVESDPVLIASQGGINFYLGNNAAADGYSAVMPRPLGHDWLVSDITTAAERAVSRSLIPGEVSAYWSSQALEWIQGHPGEAVALLAKKLCLLLLPGEIANNRDVTAFVEKFPWLAVVPVSFGILLPIGLLGILVQVRNIAWRAILTTFIALAAVLVLFFVTGRFRVPLWPYLFIGAAASLEWGIRQWRTNGCRVMFSALALVLAIVLLHALPLPLDNVAPYPHRLLAESRHWYQMKQFDRALTSARQALAVAPEAADVYLALGNAWLRLGNVDSAATHFRLETERAPERALAFSNLATLAMLRGEHDQAVALAHDAVTRRPHDLTANRILLRALLATETLPVTAIVDSANAASARTRYRLIVCNEAVPWLLQRQGYDEAEQLLTAALANPNPPLEIADGTFEREFPNGPARLRTEQALAWQQLGMLAGMRGDFGSAVQLSRNAIAADSTRSGPYANLMTAYRLMGNHRLADSIQSEIFRRFGALPNHLAPPTN